VILFGGIETTEGMISNALVHLLSHPGELARIEADRGLLPNAVEESLRLEPAAAVIDRYATRDVQIAGSAIRSRELVEISIAGANRDPAFFADPDRFDVGRARARHHLAFAHGPHVCVGMHLARLEARTAIARILRPAPRPEARATGDDARAGLPQAGGRRRLLEHGCRPRMKKGGPGGAPLRTWRLPTLPGGCPPSTIGASGLNFSVRNGKRCFPAAITAKTCTRTRCARTLKTP
jgi:Cytochrome P450